MREKVGRVEWRTRVKEIEGRGKKGKVSGGEGKTREKNGVGSRKRNVNKVTNE